MLFEQLFLLAEDAMSIWKQKGNCFFLLNANQKAYEKRAYQNGVKPQLWDEWFSEREKVLLTSLCNEALKKQERHQCNEPSTHFIALPLSMDSVAIIEKKQTTIFPFLTCSSELLLNISHEQTISDHSLSYETLTGFSREDLKGKSLFEFVHKDDRKKVRQTLTKVLKNKSPLMVEWRMWSIHDTYLAVETSFSPILNEQNEIVSTLLIGRDITKRKEHEEKLYHLAFHDPLTELPNRRLFMEQLKQTIYHYERKNQPFAIFLLDCDHFKYINDTYGHDIGDEIIKGFSNRVKALIRKSDILSRFGGDEFSLLLPEVRSKEDVEQIANRIIEQIQEPWVFNDVVIQITTSVGVFYVDENTPNVTMESALKNADVALYQAKNNGKNHFQLYEIHRTAND